VNFLPIHQALDAQVQTVSGLPTFTTEGTASKPGEYTRGSFLPARTELPTFDGVIQRGNGLYQIDVYIKSSKSYEVAIAMADTIIAAFVPASVLSNGSTQVRVLNSYPMAASNATPGYYRVSVIVEWESWL